MIRSQCGLFTAAAVAIAGITAVVSAQAPAASMAARHVRSAPIKVGRLVSAPVLDGPGSFAPLPDTVRGVNIVGIVQNHMGVLVPNAGLVVVRDLASSQIVGRTTVNALAQFSVRGLPPGIYTAELVQAGMVVANTPAFSAAVGEVIQISHTIPAAPPTAFLRVARSATSLALSAAASSGVLAITPGVAVSPPR